MGLRMYPYPPPLVCQLMPKPLHYNVIAAEVGSVVLVITISTLDLLIVMSITTKQFLVMPHHTVV